MEAADEDEVASMGEEGGIDHTSNDEKLFFNPLPAFRLLLLTLCGIEASNRSDVELDLGMLPYMYIPVAISMKYSIHLAVYQRHD